MTDVVGFAVKAAGVESIKRAVKEAIRSAKATYATTKTAAHGGGGSSSPPKRQLFALILAQPQAEYARVNIFPFQKHWHFESGRDIHFIFPGFAGEELETFSDETFHEVLEWLRASFDDFSYSGLTTVVVFASSAEHLLDLEPIDYSAFLFFDIETMQAEGFIPEPRKFFQGLIDLAHAHPGDDALWDLSSGLNDSSVGKAVVTGTLDAVKETVKKYIHLPDKELGDAVKIRRYTKVHRGRPG